MPEAPQKLIIIGNGMAAIRLLEELIEKQSPFDITVFGSEPHAGYNRILLSPLLSGEQTLNDVVTHPIDWYDQHGITLHTSKTVTDISASEKRVRDIDGDIYHFDKLVIATGSQAFLPPIPGNDLNGVYTYRTINDVEQMLSSCQQSKQAVVIGGGLLGLEVAYGLHKQGMNVTVLHRHTVLMERQLDETASEHLTAMLANTGLSIKTDVNIKKILGDEKVESVLLEDGSSIPAELVVFAVGIRPEISLAKKSDIDCAAGIIVNDQMQTSCQDIFAIGECCQHNDKTYGLVAPLYEQAAVCATVLNNETASYTGSVNATGLKVTGVNLFSAGQFCEDDSCQIIKLVDSANSIYRKLVIKHNRIVGILLYGDITDSRWYLELLETKQDITAISQTLQFGKQYCVDVQETVAACA